MSESKVIDATNRRIPDQFRWMFVLFSTPGTGVDFETPHEEYLRRVKELVGDDSIPVEIVQVSKWYINEIVAEYYSKDNMYIIVLSHVVLLLTLTVSALATQCIGIHH